MSGTLDLRNWGPLTFLPLPCQSSALRLRLKVRSPRLQMCDSAAISQSGKRYPQGQAHLVQGGGGRQAERVQNSCPPSIPGKQFCRPLQVCQTRGLPPGQSSKTCKKASFTERLGVCFSQLCALCLGAGAGQEISFYLSQAHNFKSC